MTRLPFTTWIRTFAEPVAATANRIVTARRLFTRIENLGTVSLTEMSSLYSSLCGDFPVTAVTPPGSREPPPGLREGLRTEALPASLPPGRDPASPRRSRRAPGRSGLPHA